MHPMYQLSPTPHGQAITAVLKALSCPCQVSWVKVMHHQETGKCHTADLSREAENCTPLVLHANCHVSVMHEMDNCGPRGWAHGRPRRTISNNWPIHGHAVCYACCTKHWSQNHLDTMLRHHRCYVVVSQATPVLILIRGWTLVELTTDHRMQITS